MPKFSVKKPLTIFVAVLAIIVLGVVAYLKMTPDLIPNMDFPYVIIVTTDPGASPEGIEAEITKPIEQSMATLDQIKSVTSSSQDSMSMVILEFEDTVNMDTISVDIQQKISMLQGKWDDNVAAPFVLKINPSMLPVEVAAVSYEGRDVNELSEFVNDTLATKLEGISGVASVTVSGTVTSEAHVILSQKKLDALSKTLTDAINGQLDNAAHELYSARDQVESAKQAMADAQQSAIGGAVESALGTVQSGIQKLQTERENLVSQQEKLKKLAEEKVTTDASLMETKAQIAVLEAIDQRTKEQDTQLSELKKTETTLNKQEKGLEAQFAAYGTTGETVQKRLDELQDNIDKVDQNIQSLTKDSTISDLSKQVTSGVVSGLDAITQMSSGTVQISQALSQIDEGLSTISSYRDKVAQQSDLSGMLNINTLSGILTAQNFSMPAGYIDDNDGVSYMVSVGDAFKSRDQLEKLLLFDLGIDGVEPIYLGDVADVFVTDDSADIYTKVNGENGVIATFTKQSNYATAEVSDNIAHRFAQLESEYEGLSFKPLMDQGEYIHLIVTTILSSLLWGALFSVVVLYLFLRDWRPTVITLVSIPVSVIFAVVLMYFTGVTINMISLSGLAVAVGMLVDNSVVVIENIYRLRSKGATVIQAAVSGAQQVLGAIVASTLTTVCVFVPIVFVEGLTRQLFTDLALTMTYALMASLLVALTVVPAMSCGMLRKEYAAKPGILDKIYPAYRKAITWSLEHKAVVLLLSLALLIGSAWGALSRGFEFMPEMDMNNLNISITMPEGCTKQEAMELADQVVEKALTVDNIDTVGAMMTAEGNSLTMLSADNGAYGVTLYITLPEGEFGMVAGRQIEKLCKDMPCEVVASPVMSMDMLTGSGITLNVYGDDMEDLQTAAKKLAACMEKVDGTEKVSDGLDEAAPALHISIDRTKAMKKGMTVAQIYMQIAAALTDTTTNGSMTLDNTNMDVIIESAEDSRLTRETLLDLEIVPDTSMTAGAGTDLAAMGALTGEKDNANDNGSFRLGDVAKVKETVSLNTIQRDQQRRCLSVKSGIAEGHNVTLVTADVQKAVENVKLPDGVTTEFSGENEAIMEAIRQMLLMMVLGIILVYFVMVAQFQSLKSPFIVMFTIPLAFTGGFIALLISGIEVSVISLIGFVMLVGIIVNNGIVLVDYINQQRLSGMERREAIVDAGVTRLRPILMTSLTTILGLIVTALGRNAGTALMQPVALVCIGGLLYATLMTLFVVPCMYDIVNKKELRKVDEEELKLLDL
ncbi:MAG: efflux RND transporter permease subunit [Clostridiales bacterium]|nr:efflux RND transporter permease subunit [Candidatus Cacconaster stercorequi]